MAFILKGIEIENFKSYVDRQRICFSDLSVLLGANSSGKSTALQALLAIKQTMECNSPDEELLLSGKFVALGDYNDVISDERKEEFGISAILEQTEASEISEDRDCFRIDWFFGQEKNSTDAILSRMDILYENMKLSFRRAETGFHNMFVNEKESRLCVHINNLLISDYVIRYDKELNTKASVFLNAITKLFVAKKTATISDNTPVCFLEIEKFYFKLLSRIRNSENKPIQYGEKENSFANRLDKLLETYRNLEIPKFLQSSSIFPHDLRLQILQMACAGVKDMDALEHVISTHEEYINNYEDTIHQIEEFRGEYHLGASPFKELRAYSGKDESSTQLEYALEFYKDFQRNIISKIFFVGPIRENPKGLYNIGFETVPKYVGTTGSFFASVLLHEDKKKREYIVPDGKGICTLSEALAAWMIHLNIASGISVDKKNSFGFSVSIENMEQVRADIMNVGIGTSQVLPVMISILLSDPNEILIFEQPELHLHPYSQSRLADMFVAFCKNGRKIILETHSEYFLLRLRYHIVKENFSPDKAAVNFFQNEEGTKVNFANISGYGNIEYPKDFRDETQDLLDALLDAALERKGLT